MYVTFCGLQGHHRSKVMVPNESLYAISYLSIIVTAGLLVQELGGFYLCFVYQKVVWYHEKGLCL